MLLLLLFTCLRRFVIIHTLAAYAVTEQRGGGLCGQVMPQVLWRVTLRRNTVVQFVVMIWPASGPVPGPWTSGWPKIASYMRLFWAGTGRLTAGAKSGNLIVTSVPPSLFSMREQGW